MVYQWKTNIYPVDAQSAGEELERITKKNGELTPSIVVDESRNEKAVLHNCFEWNDDKAAEEYRRHQARVLICNVTVTKIKDQKPSVPVRAYAHIQKEYKPINVVLKSEDLTNEMLKNALRELTAFKSKYKALCELKGLFSEIDKLVEEYDE